MPARVSSMLCSAHASAVRRQPPVSGSPAPRSAGQVSGAATANSRNPGPNQIVESRVRSGAKSRPVSPSTAATGRPACVQGPRWISVHSGTGRVCARLSRSGIGTTIHVARPLPSRRGTRAAAVGVARGPRYSRRRATASTRGPSHRGTVVAAASRLGNPGGARESGPSPSRPNASASSRRSSAASPPSSGCLDLLRLPPTATIAGSTRNATKEPPSRAPQLPARSVDFSRTPHTRLATVAATPNTAMSGAAGSRVARARRVSAPCSPATACTGSSSAPQVRVRPRHASSTPRWARACALAYGSQRRNRSEPIPR